MWLHGLLERALLFHPTPGTQATPADLGLPYRPLALTTPDGERLSAWWIPARERATILYLHGNAGNLSALLPKAAFLARLGTSLLLLDYRGYGASTGTPSVRGTAIDARAAYRELGRGLGVPPERVVLWGESLGSAVAARLAVEAKAAALVLESPFTSGREMVPVFAPFLPGGARIIGDRLTTRAHVRAGSIPTLVIHGDADPVIPLAMGRAVFEAAAPPRRLVQVRGGGHGALWEDGGEDYLAAVREFLAAALGGLAP